MAAVEIDRRIRDDATTVESAWRDWLARLEPAALELDELLHAEQRLVVVSPHPDDEVLACGGLIALHVERGGPAAVIAVTDGEASHKDDPGWTPERLSDARRVERRRGLARLGLTTSSVTRLALRDSEVAMQRVALEHGLRQYLRPTDCVVGTWQLDGHPDHDATGSAAARVCADLGCRLLEAPVWMWQWSAPGDPRVPWHRMRHLQLPVGTLARKTAALAAHRTQLAPRANDAPVLGPELLVRAARTAEYFFV